MQEPTAEACAAHGKSGFCRTIYSFPKRTLFLKSFNEEQAGKTHLSGVDSGPEAFDDLLIDPPNLVPP